MLKTALAGMKYLSKLRHVLLTLSGKTKLEKNSQNVQNFKSRIKKKSMNKVIY